MSDPSPSPRSANVPRQAVRLIMVALALGVAIDVLFRRQSLGISFPIWSALSAGALVVAARWEGVRPHRSGLALAAGIVVLSLGVAFRLEPLTVALSVLGTLALFMLWLRSLRTGRLHRYGWLDFAATALWAPVETVFRPWATLSDGMRKLAGDRAARSRGAALMRGALLASPVLLVFLVLLTSADLVFRDLVERALEWLDLEWIRDLIGHGAFIAAGGLVSLGALVTAVRRRDSKALIGEVQPLVPRFLGWTEAAMVLGSVDLLFAVFVAIQFRYLFGGEANISQAGYSYAEYARRGFGEMVWAALIGQGLVLSLAQYTRFERRGQRRAGNALSAGLLALLLVTLLSALTRLLLYEQAYGFTRARTYGHLFIYWLAAALPALLVLLYLGRLRSYAPVCAVAAVGFALTLSALNVDGFIAARNLDRFQRTGDLDLSYLARLTGDAVPALAERAAADSPPGLLALLACRRAEMQSQDASPSWQSLHFGRSRAGRSLQQISGLLQPYHVGLDGQVRGPGIEARHCRSGWAERTAHEVEPVASDPQATAGRTAAPPPAR